MTLFDAEGWQTDTNTDCLNDSLFGQLTSAHKKGEKKEWRTTTNLQQYKNKNTKQSVKKGPKSNKKGPKRTKIEEKQRPNSKKSKSHDSSNSRNPLTCGTARTQTWLKLGTTQVSAEQCHEQVEQSTKSQSKKKVNKRNKYRHLALKAAEEDVEVISREIHTENKRSREQEKRKRKPTGMDDGTVQKVAKQKLSGDATSNSETPKKKKRKLKKGTSSHTKGGVLETVSGGNPPRHKRHVTDDVMGDVEAESADNAPVTFIGIRKSQTEAKRKRKTDNLKHSAEIATSIKNDLDSTSANLPPTASCVKGKAAARPASAATAVKRRSQYPFSIARLKAVFQHEATNTSNVSHDVPETEDASKTQENATKCKSDGNVPAQSSSPQTLRERMQQKLNSARFRYINEQLYRRTGEEAHRLFTEDPETFQVYHEGYQSQIAKWPVNPVNKVIEYISSRPASLVVADLGCGDAKVSRAVPNRIHSFDLVAVNDSVTACDITQVPLEDNSVDIAVFCLSLMGTDFVQFLCEANRILRLGGKLLVAEVVSRFDKIGAFVRKLTKLGFSLQDKDTSNTMFVWFEFMKIGKPDLEKLPKIVLMPCVYKKR